MTRNNTDFQSGIEVSHTNNGWNPGETIIFASHPDLDGGAYMVLSPSHVVQALQVDEGARRHGLATRMWNYAKEQGMQPKHSSRRTESGDAWAKTTGDPVPRLTERVVDNG